jgi:hypothetical protein
VFTSSPAKCIGIPIAATVGAFLFYAGSVGTAGGLDVAATTVAVGAGGGSLAFGTAVEEEQNSCSDFTSDVIGG